VWVFKRVTGGAAIDEESVQAMREIGVSDAQRFGRPMGRYYAARTP
jgi:hypothetical protein